RRRGGVVPRRPLAPARPPHRRAHPSRRRCARRRGAQGEALPAALRSGEIPPPPARLRYALCTGSLSEFGFTKEVLPVAIRARRTPFKLRKLLIIDDDATILALYRDLLLPYGFQVLTAPDGQEAIPI